MRRPMVLRTSVLLSATVFGCAVLLGQTASPTAARTGSAANAVSSTLNTISTDSDNAMPRAVYKADTYFEAPNWTRDGASLIFDGGGRILRVPVAGGTPTPIDVGSATRCTGSHGLSPDGTLLAISCITPELPGTRVYTLPLSGGTPKVVTETANSYWHSWSPDGQTLLFTRPSQGSINIYAIGVNGGAERALTQGTGISDDPDYSPDGQYIYFNSDRAGTMEIWRMYPDGSSPEQITFDDSVNWTPHVSPDGTQMVFVSYAKGVTGHPTNKSVALRLMTLKDRKVRVLTRLTGGSGTINVPSWAPDSRHLAYVSFQVTGTP